MPWEHAGAQADHPNDGKGGKGGPVETVPNFRLARDAIRNVAAQTTGALDGNPITAHAQTGYTATRISTPPDIRVRGVVG